MNQEKIWAYFQNEGAAAFDAAIPRHRFISSRILKLATTEQCRVLNIGIGEGYLERRLRSEGLAVSSMDPDQRAVGSLSSEGIAARVGSAEDIPWRDGLFDFVVASELLEHLSPEQCRLALLEISRVLVPGGYLLGSVPLEENLSDNIAVCPECGRRFHRWGHQQTFTAASLRKTLEASFAIEKLSRRSFPNWEGGAGRKLRSAVRWLLGRVGERTASPHLFFRARNAR